MATAALHKMNLSAPDLSAMVPSLPSLDLPGLPTLDLRSSKGHKKHKAGMSTTTDASQSTMAAATSMPDMTSNTAGTDGSAAAASSLGALDRLIPTRSRDGELALLLSSPHPATTTTRLPPGASPVPTSTGAKRRGLRGKVKGALRRMVSNDESVFSRNHLVFRGDNESTTSHLTNIHSTHSGTSIPIQPATAAETNAAAATDGGAAAQPQHHPRTSDASATAPRTSSTSSSTTNLPAPRSPKPPAHSASAASKNLTKKFNASMQYFLSTVNAVAPINLSPKPGNSAAVRKHQQRLASITSTTSLDQLPFEDGDDEDDKESSSSTSSEEEVSRSKSPAMQRRLERRRRKKKRLGQKSHNNSSKAKLEHSSNPRLRRRHKHYRKIKTPTKTTPQTDDEHEQDADNKDIKTLVAKTNSNSSNNSKGLQKTTSARDKPRARSAPRSHSQKMIRVQQEDAAAPLIPGEAFLKCVLDDIHAKKAASGELVIASEDNVTDEDEDDDQEALLPKGVKKSSHGSSKKGHHSSKKPIARKKKTKKEPQPETPKSTNKGEEAVALLSPEASAHGGGEDNASSKSKPERDEIGEALQASTQHDSDCDKDKDESELPTPKRRTKGAWGAKADPGQDFKSQASSKELGDFDNDDEGSDNKEGGSDDDDDEEEEEDMPPYLVAMLEPEDSPEHDKAKGKAGGEPEDEGESILLAMAGEDSVAPLVQRSGSELMAEVEKSLKDFDIRKTTTKANNSLQDFMVMAHDLPETPSALTESIDPSELLQKEDSFKMTPDFKFSFSNVVVAKKADGSPSSLDDTAVLDIKAKVEKKKKLRRPTGMVRGQSLSDLRLQPDPKPAHNINNDNNKTTLEDLLEGTDFFDELLNSLMTAPTKPASEPSSPEPPKMPVRRDTLKLDRNELPLADTSIGSGSRRGRSRSTRKRSSTTNGAPSRPGGRASTTTKMKDGSGRVATDGSSRRKAQRKHNLKQNSDSHLIGAKTRQRSKSSSKHLARSESQLPEARERSKSHSRRDDPARRSKGGRREGSRRRMSLGGSEKKHESKEERERSRSTSKESRQSGEVKTTTKDRDRSTSKESRESGQVKTTRDRDRSSSKESRQSGRGKTTRDSSKRPKARSSQVGHRERSKSKSKRESHRHMYDRSNKSNSTRDLRETGDHQRSSRRHLSQSAGNLHSRDGERERSRSKSKSARLGGHRAISKSQSISHSYNDTERSRRRRSLEGGRRRKTISHAQSAEGGDKLSSKLVDGDKPTRAETSLEPVKRQDRRQRRTSLRDPVVKQRVSERMHRSVGILDFPGAFAEESNPAKDSKTKKKKAGMRRQVSDSTLVVADKTLKEEEPEDLVKLAKRNPKDRDKRVDVDDGVRRSAHGDSSHATTAGEGSQSTQQASNVGTLSKTSSRSRSGSAERTEKRLASHKAISQSKLTDGAKDESGEKQFTEAAKPTLEHAATHEVEGDAPKQEGSKTGRAERPKRRKSHQSIRPRSQSKEPSSRSRSTREHSRRSSATSGREKETTSRGKSSSTNQDRKTRRAGDSTRDTRSSVILSKRTSQRLRESQSERPARTIDKAIIVPSGHSSSSSERQDRRVSFDADTAEAAIANGAGLKGILKKNKVVAKRPRRDTRKVSAAPISQQSSANEHQTRT